MEKVIGMLVGGLPFDGNVIKEKALGGSETAGYYMAKELAALGNKVFMFCKCSRQDTFEGVTYLPIDALRDIGRNVDFDVFIVQRHGIAPNQEINASFFAIWCHDVLTNPGWFLTQLYGQDKIFLLSDYHVNLYTEPIPELKKHVWRTQNGVDLDLIKNAGEELQPKIREKHVVYAARPERGLPELITRVMPRLWEVFPDLKLHVTTYDVTGTAIPPQMLQFYDQVKALIAADPRIIDHGTLRKEDLYKLYKSCALYLYPTDFPEISCISALETMACGAPIITTKDFALTETVPFQEVLIKGKRYSAQYIDEFVKTAVYYLLHTEARMELASRMKRWVELNYSWAKVAKEWDREFDYWLMKRAEENPKGVVEALRYNSDLVAAKEVAEFYKLKEEKEDIENLLKEIEERPSDVYHIPKGKEDMKEVEWERIPRLSVAADHLIPGTVLDLGCHYGEGSVTFINKRSDITKAVGIDWSGQCIDVAREFLSEKCNRPDAVSYAIGDVSLADPGILGEFDNVFAGELLEHVANYKSFLHTIEKLAKIGGKVVLTLPSGPWECGANQPREMLFHVRHWTWKDINDVFGDKKDFRYSFINMGVTIRGDFLGNWVVSYTRTEENPTFGTIDVERKRKATRPYQKISACMIVKNEQEHIAKCLKSFRDVVDEVLVTDTGSTDRTVEICKNLGAVVKQIDWPDSFAAARNESIKDAKGDWIFWIDADETLENPRNLRKYTKGSVFEGFLIRQNHLTIDMKTNPDVPCRFFRRRPHYKFIGVIHEHVEDTSLGEFDNPLRPTMLLPDVDIAHYGYMTEVNRRIKCAERNLALLIKDRKQNPERKMGIVLLMRDYINLTNWEMESTNGRPNEKVLRYLREVVKIWRSEFEGMKQGSLRSLAYPIYQAALERLGRLGAPVSENGDVADIPFEVALALGGAIGGMKLDKDAALTPMRTWFSTPAEMHKLISEKGKELAKVLRLEDAE